jgi:hypothetical protein
LNPTNRTDGRRRCLCLSRRITWSVLGKDTWCPAFSLSGSVHRRCRW